MKYYTSMFKWSFLMCMIFWLWYWVIGFSWAISCLLSDVKCFFLCLSPTWGCCVSQTQGSFWGPICCHNWEASHQGVVLGWGQKLDEIQNEYLRLIYSCPPSTPKPALRSQAGMPNMKHRIWLEKVSLVSSILHTKLDQDNYAREILNE